MCVVCLAISTWMCDASDNDNYVGMAPKPPYPRHGLLITETPTSPGAPDRPISRPQQPRHGGLGMPSTEIENYEPEDEGWSIVIGPLFKQRPTTPSDETNKQEQEQHAPRNRPARTSRRGASPLMRPTMQQERAESLEPLHRGAGMLIHEPSRTPEELEAIAAQAIIYTPPPRRSEQSDHTPSRKRARRRTRTRSSNTRRPRRASGPARARPLDSLGASGPSERCSGESTLAQARRSDSER